MDGRGRLVPERASKARQRLTGSMGLPLFARQRWIMIGLPVFDNKDNDHENHEHNDEKHDDTNGKGTD